MLLLLERAPIRQDRTVTIIVTINIREREPLLDRTGQDRTGQDRTVTIIVTIIIIIINIRERAPIRQDNNYYCYYYY